MISFVNAKLNLGLNILRKRPDGYHDLSTVFYPVGLYNGTPENPEPFCDILEVTGITSPIETMDFVFSGNEVNCPLEKNLVVKAVNLFTAALEEKMIPPGGLRISLVKKLPDGAGLGGGSADASFTLRMLNEVYDNFFSVTELIAMAATLGADCPFFILNRPVYATGIGEKMESIDLDLSGKWAAIVKPDIYVSTKEAFSGIIPDSNAPDITGIVKLPVSQWENAGLKNDFERHIFELHPILKEIKNSLKANGAEYAAMSGSGSSLFGIFPTKGSAEKAVAEILRHFSQISFSTVSKL